MSVNMPFDADMCIRIPLSGTRLSMYLGLNHDTAKANDPRPATYLSYKQHHRGPDRQTAFCSLVRLLLPSFPLSIRSTKQIDGKDDKDPL